MRHFSRVDWAAELGIDLDALHREHPSHPDQLRNHRAIAKKGAEYWARERFLAQLEYSFAAILVEDVAPVEIAVKPRAKIRVKPTRIGKYDLTLFGYEIARIRLNARRSV